MYFREMKKRKKGKKKKKRKKKRKRRRKRRKVKKAKKAKRYSYTSGDSFAVADPEVLARGGELGNTMGLGSGGSPPTQGIFEV